MPAIEIFRPVNAVKSMEGVDVTLTDADLRSIAAGYNRAVHEAPLTIGHPTHDAPAYGWVKALSFADGSLSADCEQSPELGELVSQGRYRKVSASFYTPSAPGNPTPGQWALRHVGFLGAQAPGVKGLRAVSFAESEEGVVTFGELPGYAGGYIARMFSGLREWFIAEKGKAVADQVLPAYEVESLREISQRAEERPADDQFSGGTPSRSFAEPGNATTRSQQAGEANHQEKPPMKTVEQLQAELDDSNAKLARMQTAEQTRLAAERSSAAQSRHAAHVSFAEGLVASAKWPTDAKDVLVHVLDVVGAPGEAGVVSFGEGDAAKPLVAALQEKLQALPASVSFAEVAKGGGKALTDREIAERAAAYQARMQGNGQSISLSTAIDAVNNGTDKA